VSALYLLTRLWMRSISNKIGGVGAQVFPPVAEPSVECGRLEIGRLDHFVIFINTIDSYSKGLFVFGLVLVAEILVPVGPIFQANRVHEVGGPCIQRDGFISVGVDITPPRDDDAKPAHDVGRVGDHLRLPSGVGSPCHVEPLHVPRRRSVVISQ